MYDTIIILGNGISEEGTLPLIVEERVIKDYIINHDKRHYFRY